MKKEPKTKLHLVLTHHWYDQLGWKDKEYREASPKWIKQIWDVREELIGKPIIFHRAYTSTVTERMIYNIEKGPCPIDGWDDPEYIVITYSPF